MKRLVWLNWYYSACLACIDPQHWAWWRMPAIPTVASDVKGNAQHCSEFETSLGYNTPCLKRKKKVIIKAGCGGAYIPIVSALEVEARGSKVQGHTT